MRDARIARGWIWAALALQAVGLAFDGVWHGLIRPDCPSRYRSFAALPWRPQRRDYQRMGVRRAKERIGGRLRRRAAVDGGGGLARVNSSQAEHTGRPDRRGCGDDRLHSRGHRRLGRWTPGATPFGVGARLDAPESPTPPLI